MIIPYPLMRRAIINNGDERESKGRGEGREERGITSLSLIRCPKSMIPNDLEANKSLST